MSDSIEALTKRPAKKPSLGRGLGSLLGPALTENNDSPTQTFKNTSILENKQIQNSAPLAPQVPDHARIWQVDVAKLAPNENQPRKSFPNEALRELAQSIKEKGILQPIVARPLPDGKFEIIAGERRWRAAQTAGLKEVPVILKNPKDQEALELALIENIQREDLNPIEEAEAYQHLIQTYNLTQQTLADQLGKDRATVANVLRLLALTREVRQMVASGQLSMGHAKVLLAIQDPVKQKSLALQVISKKFSVRELERQVAQLLTPPKDEARDSIGINVSEKFMTGLAEELQKMMGTKVSLDYEKGKGKIAIHFYSDEQLNSLVDRLREKWRK